jgi:hypothetical protein
VGAFHGWVGVQPQAHRVLANTAGELGLDLGFWGCPDACDAAGHGGAVV